MENRTDSLAKFLRSQTKHWSKIGVVELLKKFIAEQPESYQKHIEENLFRRKNGI